MEHDRTDMIDMGCPECGGEIELYDINTTGTGGRYRCKQCPRDTVWALGKSKSLTEILGEIKACLSCDKSKQKGSKS